MTFDKVKFEKEFNGRIGTLAKAEKSVRAEVNWLSRAVLEALHSTENIGYVNQLLQALTPINRKAAIVFFKHFGGFHYDDATAMFTKKSKKRYDQAHRDALAFLQDPNNNMFSWAQRHIEVEQKPFDIASFKKGFKSYIGKHLQQAKDNGLSQKELLGLMFEAGIEVDAVLEVMQQSGKIAVTEVEAE